MGKKKKERREERKGVKATREPGRRDKKKQQGRTGKGKKGTVIPEKGQGE